MRMCITCFWCSVVCTPVPHVLDFFTLLSTIYKHNLLVLPQRTEVLEDVLPFESPSYVSMWQKYNYLLILRQRPEVLEDLRHLVPVLVLVVRLKIRGV